MPYTCSNYEMPAPLVHLTRFVKNVKASHVYERNETCLGKVLFIICELVFGN
jgi:hypothetical protein